MIRLRDIMTTDVATVTPQTSLRDAMELLASRHVSGAPVVAGGKLVGVISASDLLSFVASAPGAPTERADDIEWGDLGEADDVETAIDREDEPGSMFFSDMWDDSGVEASERMAMVEGPEWNVLEEHVVSEAMTRPLVTLPPDADVIAAAELMQLRMIHRILVVDHGILVGIVSSMDVTRVVSEHRLETHRYVFARSAVPSRQRWP